MNEDYKLTLSDELLDKLFALRNATAIKVVLDIWNRIYVKENELAEKHRKSERDINKILYSVKNNGFRCDECEYGKKVKQKGLRKKVWACGVGTSCADNYPRVVTNVLELMKASGYKKTQFKDLIGKGRGNKSRETTKKKIEDWNTNDFVDFYYNKHQKSYSHISSLKKGMIRRYVVKLREAFQVEFEERWQYVLKRYVRYTFKQASEKEFIPSLQMMCEKNIIMKFVNQEATLECNTCGKYKIYCPYWNEECVLTEKCKKSLRKKIKKKFN